MSRKLKQTEPVDNRTWFQFAEDARRRELNLPPIIRPGVTMPKMAAPPAAISPAAPLKQTEPSGSASSAPAKPAPPPAETLAKSVVVLEKVGGDAGKSALAPATPVGESSRDKLEGVLKLYGLDLEVLADKFATLGPRVLEAAGHHYAGIKSNEAIAQKMVLQIVSVRTYFNTTYGRLGLKEISSTKHRRLILRLAYGRFLEKKAAAGGNSPLIDGEGIGTQPDSDPQLEAVRLLTTRRRAILKCRANGLEDKKIVDELKITGSILMNEMTHIYRALGISDLPKPAKRAEAARIYHRFAAKYLATE